MVEKKLDLKGFVCPIPVLKVNKEIRGLDEDDIVICEVTDPAAPDDFKNFCNTTGNVLLNCERTGDCWVITIEKSRLRSG